MNPKGLLITIDGPAGAGKSSASKALAKALHYTYVNTGSIYRTIAFAAHKQSVPWEDQNALLSLLSRLSIEFRIVDGESHVFLDQTNVEKMIRTPTISQGASIVSAHPLLREALLHQQRQLGQHGAAIVEGRDTGSVVFPHADVKFYVDASPYHRAKRRYQQLGSPLTTSIEQLQDEIEQRDRADRERVVAPLICPDDAITIETSTLSLEEVVAVMLRHIRSHPSHVS